ncbi:SMI1/KNR4 family protein [Zavarzinella formosa]|uniref:SMI1/KNR4 family protein n=1 Tax=Zavarzinella formosa TaxID=360055 RepID=UPI00035C575F|nr:SMI1/KNR4 family protein [Zavarzinella formosa]
MDNNIHNLDYFSDSLLLPFDEKILYDFQNYINSITERNLIRFEKDYVEHLTAYHGGIPRRRLFYTKEGQERLVERFLNFIDRKKESAFAQYQVGVMWSLVSDRMGENLIPFALLFGGDLLCFDFRSSIEPTIVVWLHEKSRAGDEDTDFEPLPATEEVAQNFMSFLQMLYEG